MNDEFLRMKKLLENTGLSFKEGGLSYSELYAYSAAIALLRDDINKNKDIIFLSSSNVNYYARWSDMLKTDLKRFSLSDFKDEIVRRLSMKYAQSDENERDWQFSLTGGKSCVIDENGTVLSGLKLKDLKEAGKFLLAYSPCSLKTKYSGSNERISWNMWDRTGFSFNDYSGLNLPWEFLNTLRSDIFEQ